MAAVTRRNIAPDFEAMSARQKLDCAEIAKQLSAYSALPPLPRERADGDGEHDDEAHEDLPDVAVDAHLRQLAARFVRPRPLRFLKPNYGPF